MCADLSDQQKKQANEAWAHLAQRGLEIDVGGWWRDVVDEEKFAEPPAPDVEVSLPWGSTDRPGYELLPRSIDHLVLCTDDGGALMIERRETRRYEPVPIETVLWDGQASPATGDADDVRHRRAELVQQREERRRSHREGGPQQPGPNKPAALERSARKRSPRKPGPRKR